MKKERPFWFWNGEISHDEIRRQVHEMALGGVGGFFLHPRQGMDLPYLSDSFFEHVKTAVLAAKEEGLEVFLYDEYPYPSGVAGGELLLEPSFRARNLFRFEKEAQGGESVSWDLPWGRILLAKAYPREEGRILWECGLDLRDSIGIIYETEIFQEGTGLTEYNRKRFFTGDHAKRLIWTAPEGDWAIRVFLEREADRFKYFGGFADPLNPDAMRVYLDTVHERYERAVGSEFGKTVRGIFTDEVAPFAGGDCIWSPLLPDLYRSETGDDLIERLPLLFEDGPGASAVRYRFHDIVTRAFIRSFDEPVSRWCANHHLLYAGEKPHLRGEQIAMMHIPGCDTGHQKAGDEPDLFGTSYRSNPKAVASASHFFRDGTALCEAYHSVGWGMTLRDMRWMADWIGLQGITDFVPHAFYYSTSALRKHDAPPSEFACMPWWKHNGLYAGHLERLAAVQEGKRVVPVLILDSAPSVWTAGEGRMNAAERNRRYESLTDLQRALAERQLDYYIIDRNVFPDIHVSDGRISLHGETYEALVLPESRTLENEALLLLAKLTEGGASVYTWGEPASDDIGFGSPETVLRHLEDKGMHCEESLEVLADDLRERFAPLRLRVLSEGKTLVLCGLFEKDGVSRLVMTNTARRSVTAAVEWNVESAAFSWQDLDGGKPVQARVMKRDGRQMIFASFEPFETKVLATEQGKPSEPASLGMTVSLHKPLPMHALGDNLLRLGHWDLDSDGRDLGPVTPAPIVNQLEQLGLPVPARVTSAFGCAKEYGFSPSVYTWTTEFRMEYAGEVNLLCEKGALSDGLSVFVNGVDVTPGLACKPFWNQTDLQTDLTDILKPGMNIITVSGLVERDQDGLVNAIYLKGEFGCWKRDGIWTLMPSAEKGAVMDRIGCGLPFYAGDILYEVDETPEEHTEYCITNWAFEDCAELFADGSSCGVRAWNPYRWQVYGSGKKVELKISTALLGAFEGLQFDLRSHAWIDPEA